MTIVEIFVVLSLYIFVLFRLPEMRIAATIVAAVLMGGLLYYTLTAPSAPEEELNRIAVSEVVFEDVSLELGPRVATLSGRLVNTSKTYALTGVLFTVKLYDCETETTPLEACFTIGEDDSEARLTAPPEQLRAFDATLLFSDLPKVSGVQRWGYEVKSVRALAVVER